jgi:hypothetical protein
MAMAINLSNRLWPLLHQACQGTGLDLLTFRALLSPEDLACITAGDIPIETLHTQYQEFAEDLKRGSPNVY